MTKILIVEARFYNKVSDLLLAGAQDALKKAGAVVEVVTVPGALEIPPAICLAKKAFDGFVALGCVIRGETYHFEIVANESARGIMELGVAHSLAIGNGILTTENEEQAITRAAEKGAFAVNACLDLINIRKKYGC